MLLKAQDLRDQSVEELEAGLSDAYRQLFELNNQFRAQKKKDKPHAVRHVRKTIARMKTILTEKKPRQNPQHSE